MDSVSRRTRVLSNHLRLQTSSESSLIASPCLNYSPPELSELFDFDPKSMRSLLDEHNLEDRDWLFGLMTQSHLFNPRIVAGKVFVSPDYNQTMQQQREMTMKRISYLLDRGVFKGCLTDTGIDSELRKFALFEVIGIYDHSLGIKLVAQFLLW